MIVMKHVLFLVGRDEMKIKTVDEKNNLFIVEDIIDWKLIHEFNREDINSYSWEDQGGWWDSPRHKLLYNENSALGRIRSSLSDTPKQINDILKTNFKSIAMNCWHDLEGFECGDHIDNPEVKSVLHFYIGEASPDLGTVFYNAEEEDVEDINDDQRWHLKKCNLPIRYNFKFIQNTGYIMFNNRTQAHGVTGTISAKDKRVSCYCYLD